ncbi:MAG: FxDxF family PEP-CTERM protein [Azoarcus sp.]|nr:FxDxF family PEP-CTERM protein [Azoarcus sp.]
MSRTLAMFAVGFFVSTSAFAGPVIPLTNTLPRCVDCFAGPISIGFDINFFGNDYSQLYVNNNGNISFNQGLSNWTFDDPWPSYGLSYGANTVISPFFGDVDTTSAGSPVAYGSLIYDGRQAFAVNWVDVPRHSDSHTIGTSSSRNSFQVILVERSDVGTGDFDIVFNFDYIQWQNSNIYGGSFFGYGANGNYYGYTTNNNQLLTLNGSQLPYNSINSDVAGRYVFEVRGGVVTNPLPLLTAVPEPETWVMLLAGLGLVSGMARRRTKR